MNLSARQTAAIIPLGAIVSGSGFFLMPLLRPPHTAPTALIVVITFGLLILGFLISHAGGNRLQAGIIQERWPNIEMDALRGLVASGWFMALHFGLFALLVTFVVCARPYPQFRSFSWSCFMLVQSLTLLRSLLRNESKSTALEPKWSALQPLHSHHWGEH
jgi:hypothetical protein